MGEALATCIARACEDLNTLQDLVKYHKGETAELFESYGHRIAELEKGALLQHRQAQVSEEMLGQKIPNLEKLALVLTNGVGYMVQCLRENSEFPEQDQNGASKAGRWGAESSSVDIQR